MYHIRLYHDYEALVIMKGRNFSNNEGDIYSEIHANMYKYISHIEADQQTSDIQSVCHKHVLYPLRTGTCKSNR